MNRLLQQFDTKMITCFCRWEMPLARAALFGVYFWFGLLKLLGLSPAEPLVEALYEQTIPFISFVTFYPAFAIFEILIGLLFLWRGAERAAIALLAMHLFTTSLPLILLTDMTWQAPFVPTLTGQYIIKNVLIIVAAIVIGSKLTALKPKS